MKHQTVLKTTVAAVAAIACAAVGCTHGSGEMPQVAATTRMAPPATAVTPAEPAADSTAPVAADGSPLASAERDADLVATLSAPAIGGLLPELATHVALDEDDTVHVDNMRGPWQVVATNNGGDRAQVRVEVGNAILVGWMSTNEARDAVVREVGLSPASLVPPPPLDGSGVFVEPGLEVHGRLRERGHREIHFDASVKASGWIPVDATGKVFPLTPRTEPVPPESDPSWIRGPISGVLLDRLEGGREIGKVHTCDAWIRIAGHDASHTDFEVIERDPNDPIRLRGFVRLGPGEVPAPCERVGEQSGGTYVLVSSTTGDALVASTTPPTPSGDPIPRGTCIYASRSQRPVGVVTSTDDRGAFDADGWATVKVHHVKDRSGSTSLLVHRDGDGRFDWCVR